MELNRRSCQRHVSIETKDICEKNGVFSQSENVARDKTIQICCRHRPQLRLDRKKTLIKVRYGSRFCILLSANVKLRQRIWGMARGDEDCAFTAK